MRILSIEPNFMDVGDSLEEAIDLQCVHLQLVKKFKVNFFRIKTRFILSF